MQVAPFSDSSMLKLWHKMKNKALEKKAKRANVKSIE